MADDPAKRGLDRNFVNCGQEHEKNYILEVITEELSEVSREDARNAIDELCASGNGRHPREAFMQQLRSRLKK